MLKVFDLQIGEDGTLNGIAEEVAFASLPQAVREALAATVAGAKIVKVESLTKRDKLVAYEAATLKGAKKGEVQLGPNGGRLAHAEPDTPPRGYGSRPAMIGCHEV